MIEEYLEEKERIFSEAEERAQKIIEKYKRVDGFLDGEPWTEEMKKDSDRVLRELKLLQEKYEKLQHLQKILEAQGMKKD